MAEITSSSSAGRPLAAAAALVAVVLVALTGCTPSASESAPSQPVIDAKGLPSADIGDTTSYFRLQTIQSSAGSECLEGNRVAPGAFLGGATFMASCANVTGQLWKLTPTGSGYYQLTTKLSEGARKCFEGNRVAADSALRGSSFLDDCKAVSGQKWRFVKTDGGAYRLQTDQSTGQNQCLEGNHVADGALMDGAAFMDSCQDVTGQLWIPVPVADVAGAADRKPADLRHAVGARVGDPNATYRLQTVGSQGESRCLEGNQVADASVLKGAAFLDECKNVAGQLWRIVAGWNDESYSLQTVFLTDKSKCFEAGQPNPDATLGGAAFMNDCTGEPGQLWRFVDAGGGAYRLQTRAVVGQNRCLEGNRLADDSVLGGAAFMDTCQDVTGQLWKLVPAA